ncbi:helix-turn-helix domain-containing protein [Spirosoma oryzicola]|uniref:helix-turn-helix domain-containing protein n=1 Tax=Spirosoma oryzicola TaxID=2898794 RepID=UPI001E2AAAFF|nr:helix-turn-helix domain-containing protein [Spirosoma oryzicola]UHG93748.1 helix-turn-helix domain-containing protein [Spirosoma oryzicola]
MAQCLPAHYHIRRAANGQEGLRLVEEQLPDLVITDVMMPVLDGLSMCEQLKANVATSHIPVLVMTAKAGQDHQLAGLERGGDDYLIKPFHPQELRLRVGNLLLHQQRLRQWLYQHFTQATPPTESIPAPIDPFLAQLEQVLAGILVQPDYSVEQLAQAMGVSYHTLHRKLTALTGLTAGELMRAYRLKKAVEWLSQGQPVGEVATRVGFETLSYFAKCFKEQFGQSPSAFGAQRTSA